MAWWLFQNIVVTAGLALAVAVVCRTGRIGPVSRHALWLVVLVKFVMPPVLVWPWAAPDPLHVATLDVRVDSRRSEGGRPVAEFDASAQGDAAEVMMAGRAGDIGRGDSIGAAQALALAAIWPWLVGLWLVGSLGRLGIEAVRLVRLARRVQDSAPVDPALARRIARLSAHLGLAPVAARVVSGSAPPAVWCVGQPQLLWPAQLPPDVSDACVDGLLLHELAHVKRRDHLVGWVELAAGIVWWWNPLFWFVRSALREQAELACDAWVVTALPNGRRAYAESLLALSGAALRGTPSMAVVGIRATSRRVLERRLVMIMQGRTPLRLTRVGLFSLALVALATLPGWASASQNPPPPPSPPRAVPVVAPAVSVPVVVAPVGVAPVVVAPVGVTPVVVAPVDVAPVVVAPTVAPPARVTETTQVRQAPPPPTPRPPPPPSPMRIQIPRGLAVRTVRVDRNSLPDDGLQLIDRFETDREAISSEAQKRIDARRQEAISALEALQDRYTKEGKLDEAIAIRDYLRAGLPDTGAPRILVRRDGGRRP